MRLNAITAPELAQALITPGEIRSDGLTSMPRLGTQSGTATLPAISATRSTTRISRRRCAARTRRTRSCQGLTRRSYTIETYEQDIDTSVLSKGSGSAGSASRARPDEPAHIEYPGMFIKQAVLATGASPFYTTPTLGTTDYMVAPTA
jgi:hypothetical protein